MIVRLHFKTPDVADYALEDVPEAKRSAAEKVIAKFVEYGECVTIEIDTDAKSATVVPVGG